MEQYEEDIRVCKLHRPGKTLDAEGSRSGRTETASLNVAGPERGHDSPRTQLLKLLALGRERPPREDVPRGLQHTPGKASTGPSSTRGLAVVATTSPNVAVGCLPDLPPRGGGFVNDPSAGSPTETL